VGTFDCVCGENVVKRSQVVSGNAFKHMEDVGKDKSFKQMQTWKGINSIGLKRKKKNKICAYEQERPPLDIGDNIKVMCQDSGIISSWFRSIMIRNLTHQLEVWYIDILNEDENGNLKVCYLIQMTVICSIWRTIV